MIRITEYTVHSFVNLNIEKWFFLRQIQFAHTNVMLDADFKLHQRESAGSPESYDVLHMILTERKSSELAKI